MCVYAYFAKKDIFKTRSWLLIKLFINSFEIIIIVYWFLLWELNVGNITSFVFVFTSILMDVPITRVYAFIKFGVHS